MSLFLILATSFPSPHSFYPLPLHHLSVTNSISFHFFLSIFLLHKWTDTYKFSYIFFFLTWRVTCYKYSLLCFFPCNSISQKLLPILFSVSIKWTCHSVFDHSPCINTQILSSILQSRLMLKWITLCMCIYLHIVGHISSVQIPRGKIVGSKSNCTYSCWALPDYP